MGNLAYALGATVIAIGGVLLGFAQIVAESLYYQGRLETFDYYWYGCSCILVSGVIMVFWGYLISKYYKPRRGRRVTILHRFAFRLDLTFRPRTDIVGILAAIVFFLGLALLLFLPQL
jgi:hypothetical protein